MKKGFLTYKEERYLYYPYNDETSFEIIIEKMDKDDYNYYIENNKDISEKEEEKIIKEFKKDLKNGKI